jgi:hypothetical protein
MPQFWQRVLFHPKAFLLAAALFLAPGKKPIKIYCIISKRGNVINVDRFE